MKEQGKFSVFDYLQVLFLSSLFEISALLIKENARF